MENGKSERRAIKLAARSGDIFHTPGLGTNAIDQIATQCANCRNQLDKLLKCGVCKSVYYCNKDCQRAHWKTHKKFCVKPQSIKKDAATPNPELNQTVAAEHPYNTSTMCHGCKRFVQRIDWSNAEWNKTDFKARRCQSCLDSHYTRPIPKANSERGLLSEKQKKDFSKQQKDLQLESSAMLQSALKKSFSIRYSNHTRLAPVSYNAASNDKEIANWKKLQQLDKYEVVWSDPKNKNTKGSAHFKFSGVGPYHACDLVLELQCFLDDERYTQGGLHYLVRDSRPFWSMIINYHNYGTPLPFIVCGPGRCCGPKGEMSPSFKTTWLQLQKKYDDLFEIALEDPNRVHCQFVDTPIGCLVEDCPFSHEEE